MKKNNIIKDKSFYVSLFTIAIPIILQNSITISVNMMDTIMVGTLGEIQLSASSLANNYVEISHILNLGIATGGCILIAQYWGMKNSEAISKVVSIMFRVSFFCSFIAMIIVAVFPRQIMGLYTTDLSVIEEGVVYLDWMLPAFILHGFSIMMAFSLRSIRKVKVAFIASIFAFFTNIFFNWLFIFGKLGAPCLGIAGAAIGTVLARIVEFLVIGINYFLIQKDIKFKVSDLFKRSSTHGILFFRFGFPVIISDLFLTLGSNSVSVIMGHIGTEFVAAMAIVAPVMRLVNVITMGLSQSAATVTGNIIGGQSKEMAYKCGITCFVLSIASGFVSGLILLLIRSFAFSFYDISTETLNLANSFLVALSIITIFQAIGGVLTKGVLRGGGDSKFVMIIDTLFLWIVSIPLGYSCAFLWSATPFLVFLALRSDNILKAIFCIGRLISGKWIKRINDN